MDEVAQVMEGKFSCFRSICWDLLRRIIYFFLPLQKHGSITLASTTHAGRRLHTDTASAVDSCLHHNSCQPHNADDWYLIVCRIFLRQRWVSFPNLLQVCDRPSLIVSFKPMASNTFWKGWHDAWCKSITSYDRLGTTGLKNLVYCDSLLIVQRPSYCCC